MVKELLCWCVSIALSKGSFKADLEFNHLSSVVRVPGKIVPTFVGRLRLLSTSLLLFDVDARFPCPDGNTRFSECSTFDRSSEEMSLRAIREQIKQPKHLFAMYVANADRSVGSVGATCCS